MIQKNLLYQIASRKHFSKNSSYLQFQICTPYNSLVAIFGKKINILRRYENIKLKFSKFHGKAPCIGVSFLISCRSGLQL